ncbi:uncharacterized protein LOC116257619 isoform X7 [Nymphaea colorata]|nr:uncharacterized protein LOC116257619 isoform X7 [Nymphaea colorata]
MLTSAAPFGVVRCSILRGSEGVAAERGFPSFLPTEVEKIQDRTTRDMAKRIERVPVKTSFSKNYILSSCVKPLQKTEEKPTVLLHGFDSCSSCLEWRYTFPLLEGAGLETWALDVLGWGFSDLEQLPPCDVVSKREHLYQFWRSHIKRPMVLVGPSLGAAIAIDLAVSHPEAVSELVLIDASVYAKGTGWLSKLPRFAAYAGDLQIEKMIGGDYEKGGIYFLSDSVGIATFSTTSLSSSFQWHLRLGHPYVSKLRHLLPHLSVPESFQCEACQLGKHTRSSYSLSLSPSSYGLFDLLHVDVWGLSEVASRSRFRYFLVIVDD